MKFLAAIILGLVLTFGPTSAYAAAAPQICVSTKIIDGEPICVDTGTPSDRQTVEVPDVPVPTPDLPDLPDLPDVELPDVNVPPVPGGNGGKGGNGGNGKNGRTNNHQSQTI